MAGIDYKTAEVAVREQFAATASAAQERMAYIRALPGVAGCVLLSTCNRTELYLSCREGAVFDAAGILCRQAGLLPQEYGGYLRVRRGAHAAKHLMMVAAGLRSQIRGEDQILAQVKAAAELAREVRSSDAVLETLFRCAISAAKKAKTEVALSPVETSVAQRALAVLHARCGTLEGKRALVIGNGEMGRLAAAHLVGQGCRVTVTLRSYKRGLAVVPAGCEVVPYEERYSLMESCDILLSATASPHFTVQADDLSRCAAVPPYLVDLAVPRDIDPRAAVLPGVQACWNVDSLGGNIPDREGVAKLMAVKTIIQQYLERFYKWHSYRAFLPAAGEEKLG